MKGIDNALHHAQCVVRILRGDASALDAMQTDADGFYRSFAAIAFSIPALLFMYVLDAREMIATVPGAGMGRLISLYAFIELVAWFLPVIIFAFILGPLGLRERFSPLVVVRNWGTMVLNYLAAAFRVPELFAPIAPGVSAFFYIVLLGIVLWAALRLTRVALNTSFGMAALFVFGEVALLFGLISLFQPALPS